MVYSFDGYNWVVRFDKGDLLIKGLEELARKENITGAWVSGLGAALSAELAFYNLETKRYQFKKFSKTMEITSLQGNLAWQDNQPALHLHGSFSDEGMNAFGGHIKELEVAGTCEVLLHRWYGDKLERNPDENTGLSTLQV